MMNWEYPLSFLWGTVFKYINMENDLRIFIIVFGSVTSFLLYTSKRPLFVTAKCIHCLWTLCCLYCYYTVVYGAQVWIVSHTRICWKCIHWGYTFRSCSMSYFCSSATEQTTTWFAITQACFIFWLMCYSSQDLKCYLSPGNNLI